MEGFTREGTILYAFERCLVLGKGGIYGLGIEVNSQVLTGS